MLPSPLENLTLNLLRDCDLTVYWMTLYVGWQGIDYNGWTDLQTPFADVQDFALDCLAHCDPADEDALFRIADADLEYDPASFVAPYLRDLADKYGVSDEWARRKWRAAFFHAFLQILDAMLSADWDNENYYDFYNAWFSALHTFKDNEDAPFHFVQKAYDVAELRQSIAAVRAWLPGEKQAIQLNDAGDQRHGLKPTSK